jgi:hypothetical protein
MKKFLAAVALAGLLSGVAHAEEPNWVFVDDTDKGGRVLIDAHNIARNPNKLLFGKSRTLRHVIEGTVRFVNQPDIAEKTRFHVKIDDEDCLKYRHGDMWFSVNNDKDIHHEYWDASGGKTFDTIGNWMCDFARAVELGVDENGNPIKLPEKKEDQTQPESTPAPQADPDRPTKEF